jgi:hypothetical protein
MNLFDEVMQQASTFEAVAVELAPAVRLVVSDYGADIRVQDFRSGRVSWSDKHLTGAQAFKILTRARCAVLVAA